MADQIKWSIDPTHSDITFKVRHLMISHVNGSFKTFDASIYTTGKDFTTAEIDLWIDVTSISTGTADRDAHLTGADFFDADLHKQITFTSSTIGQADADGNHALWGEMTIKGVTRNQKLNVVFGGIMKDPWGNEKAGFTISGKFNRSDWGLTWNTALDTGGLMVGDEVSILCELELANAGFKDLKMELESITSDTK
jgi:polyisoprenoid-binding protein YceI